MEEAHDMLMSWQTRWEISEKILNAVYAIDKHIKTRLEYFEDSISATVTVEIRPSGWCAFGFFSKLSLF